MKKILINIITLVCATLPVCLLADSSFVNEYSVPVGIKVPYYSGINPIPKSIIIVLQPGDFYKSKFLGNGYIYEQYGLMPGIAEQLIKNSSTNVFVDQRYRKECDEAYKKFVAGLTSSSMPDWWVTECQKQYFEEIKKAEEGLKDNFKKMTNPHYKDDGPYEEFYNAALRSYSFLTNIPNRINELNAPNSDPDKDGLDNRTEYYCGSNPWRENVFVCYPKYLQLIPDGSPMVTGCFYIANRSPKEEFFDVTFTDTELVKTSLLLFDEYGKRISSFMLIPGHSTNKVFYVVKNEYFPACFGNWYKIDVDVDSKPVGTIIPYAPGNYSRPLKRPFNLFPQAGYCFEPGEKMLCRWEVDKNPDVQLEDNYQLQVIGLQKKFPISLGIEEKRSTVLMDKYDWYYAKIEPGIYIWRVTRENSLSDPVSSDWSWFAMGREVVPEKEKASGNDKATKESQGQTYYYLEDKTIVHELFVNVPFQYKERQFFENFSKRKDFVWNKNLTMQFDTSLPKGLSLKKTATGEDLEITGVPLEAGDFKTCLVFSNGRSEVKEEHVFKIKDVEKP